MDMWQLEEGPNIVINSEEGNLYLFCPPHLLTFRFENFLSCFFKSSRILKPPPKIFLKKSHHYNHLPPILSLSLFPPSLPAAGPGATPPRAAPASSCAHCWPGRARPWEGGARQVGQKRVEGCGFQVKSWGSGVNPRSEFLRLQNYYFQSITSSWK